MNQIFAFDDSVVRVCGTVESPCFVAKDVCRAIGIQHTSQALEKIPDAEKRKYQVHTLGGPQEVLALTEAGLYRMIFRSEKPEAEQFRTWVFNEVLPQIRKTGKFVLGGETEQQQLWQAYSEAKNWKVQLAILAALGIGREEARSAMLQESSSLPCPVRPVDPAWFWSQVAAGLESGSVSREWFKATEMESRTPGAPPVAYRLCMDPEPVLAATGAAYRQETGLPMTRAALRAGLVTTGDWVEGKHRWRFGGRVVAAWVFEVYRLSDENLLGVCDFLLKPAGSAVGTQTSE